MTQFIGLNRQFGHQVKRLLTNSQQLYQATKIGFIRVGRDTPIGAASIDTRLMAVTPLVTAQA